MGEFEDKNIFNCDETGLMFKQASKRTYDLSNSDKANGKFSKERITILFAVSKTGEKFKPLVIGKSKNPRCFKGKNKQELPIFYESNPKKLDEFYNIL